MSETRVYKLKDGTELIQREWESDSGLVFWCPEKSCVFCKKCENILYDGSGPYMFACEKIDLTESGYKGECPEFDLDEEEIQKQDELSKTRIERRENLKETMQFLKENPEVSKGFQKALFNTLMFGDGKENRVNDYTGLAGR